VARAGPARRHGDLDVRGAHPERTELLVVLGAKYMGACRGSTARWARATKAGGQTGRVLIVADHVPHR
jgi:hypothetical protein